MAAKDVIFSAAARARMLHGIDILAEAVKVTLGPKGRNVLAESAFGPPRITKDGVTVARQIDLADHFENMGAQLLRQVAIRTCELAGDGTTTAVVLAQSILREGYHAVVAGLNPMDLKRGIDMAVAAVVADLKAQATMTSAPDQLAQAATISANGDMEIGHLIADALQKVGPDGPVTVETAEGMETVLEVVEGLRFDRGYVSPYFVTDAGRMTVELEKPYILLHDKRITSLSPLVPLLEAVIKSDRSLLIVAEDVEGEALAALVVNKLQGGLKAAAVKAPEFGEHRRATLEDVAIVTGGQIVSEDLGLKLESASLDRLGTAKTVLVTKDDTTIVGGGGNRADIDGRMRQIRARLQKTSAAYDRQKLEQRLAKLSGGVAVIKVGGGSELEVNERKDRIDDALHASRAAAEEGIVAGGGAPLLYAARALDRLNPENNDQKVGIAILRRALASPLQQIAENAGVDGAVVAATLVERRDLRLGYDAQTGTYVDMIAAGIIDPTKVVRIALQGAASVAGLLITTEAMVAEHAEAPANSQQAA